MEKDGWYIGNEDMPEPTKSNLLNLIAIASAGGGGDVHMPDLTGVFPNSGEQNHESAGTAPIDMLQNRAPWGLLTDKEKAVIEGWNGKRELFVRGQHRWLEIEAIMPAADTINRTVAPPVITEEYHNITTATGHVVTVTLTLQDGKPISGTVAV